MSVLDAEGLAAPGASGTGLVRCWRDAEIGRRGVVSANAL